MMSMFLILLFITQQGYALIGYDCGTHFSNITTLSLIDVGECQIPADTVNVTQQYIQLLQAKDYGDTHVRQCKIEIHRTIFKCGWFSHNSAVDNGEAEYIFEISREACEDLHKTGSLAVIPSHVIHGLRINTTSVHSVTFAGQLSSDGKCHSAGYSDPFGSWNDVVVQGMIRVTLNEYVADVKLNNDQIKLRSGIVCTLSEGRCVDIEGGHTFWSVVRPDNCKFDQYGILYEGLANKMTDSITGNIQTVYSLETQGVTFALTSKSKESVCGYTVIRTEHPKLFIFETFKGNTFAQDMGLSVSNLDMFAYVNSKFVYVERHVRTQMKNLYRDIMMQKCDLERQTLKNSLTIATQAPDEFAFNLMKGPGHMAVVAGEVVHVIKCIPVEVKLEHGEECFSELQVSYKNTTHFLTPRTHILLRSGTRIVCNSLLASRYLVGKTWYKILPEPTETLPPHELKPLTNPSWEYLNPADLATAGIYTTHQLDGLRDRIMFPKEIHGYVNDMAREVSGHPILNGEGTILRLLNEDALSKLAASTWERMWGRFLVFGSASAGVIAIVVIIQFVKAVVNIFIRGYTLHSIFGWSFRIIGAILGSITYMFVHQHENRVTTEDPANTENSPVETIPLDAPVSSTSHPEGQVISVEERNKGPFYLNAL